MDHISELPELILQHILSFLPFKQVFQCAILAKRWKHVWSTFPILRFDHTYFNSLSKIAEGRDVWLKRGDLYSFVEQNLESRRTQRLLVKNFTLSDRLGRQKSASRVDRWLSFALESNVEELSLDFERFASICYCLPQSVLLSKSLSLLSLHRCKFDTSSTGGLINMPSLRKVCLVEVHMDNQFLQNLVAGCPALEDMKLKWCYGLKGIELSCHHRLMAIDIEENRDLERVELKAPNLCSVHIVQTSCEINLVHCKNLKKLKLQACITDDWLNDHLSELPLIETLELTSCSLLKRIEISSDQLKSLALLACWNLVEVKLDAPKLCRFNHYTRSVISLSSSNALNLSVATYGMISRDDPWNVKKIEFLSKLSNSKLLSLSLQSTENAIIPKRVRKTVSSPAYNVKHLHLFLSSPLSFTRYAIGELVDSLLWISPLLDILTIEAGSIYKPDDYDKISFKLSYEKPVYKGENSSCCKFLPFPCWRHCLKTVEIDNRRGSADKEILSNYFFENAKTLENFQFLVGGIS